MASSTIFLSASLLIALMFSSMVTSSHSAKQLTKKQGLKPKFFRSHFSRPGFPRFPRPGFPQFPRPGFPTNPMSFPQFPTPGFPSNPTPGFPQFPKSGFPISPTPNFPQFPSQGFPKFSQFPGQGFPKFPQFPKTVFPSFPPATPGTPSGNLKPDPSISAPSTLPATSALSP